MQIKYANHTRKRAKELVAVESWEEPNSSVLMLTPRASYARCDSDHKPRRVIKPPKWMSLVVFCSEQWWCRLMENSIVAHRWLCSLSPRNKSPQGPLLLSGNNVLACLCLLNNVPLHWQAENIGCDSWNTQKGPFMLWYAAHRDHKIDHLREHHTQKW